MIFLGVGVKPQFCSKGYGTDIVKKAIQESIKKYGNIPIYLDVRLWNKRAINCYLKAGFKIWKEVDKMKLLLEKVEMSAFDNIEKPS